jgi:hypothetical protein
MLTALRSLLFVAAGGVTLALAAPSGLADSPYGRPIYNPATKSYFELRIGKETRGGLYWQEAQTLATELVYKGVPGRLAVISDAETHSFLARNFDIDAEAWIGLRYWCSFRKLQWVTGDILESGAFGAWANPWHRTDLPPCESASTLTTGYMPVYYRPKSRGFRWQAVGSAKGFPRYFVEYPTGHE